MDNTLLDIAAQESFSYLDFSPRRNLALQEFVFMVGFARVARDSYPGTDIESALDKLQGDLDRGVTLEGWEPTIQPGRAVGHRVVVATARSGCGGCGGGKVR